MSWDTDLLRDLVDNEFDVPLTKEEIIKWTPDFAKPDDADDWEEPAEGEA